MGSGVRHRGPWAITLAAAALALSPSTAAADQPPALDIPDFGHFRCVLAQGEGQSITASDLAVYEATSNPPDSFTNQQPLYVDIMPHASSLGPGDLDTYYKGTDFGTMPGGVASKETPHPGVRIFRDSSFGMAHIY